MRYNKAKARTAYFIWMVAPTLATIFGILQMVFVKDNFVGFFATIMTAAGIGGMVTVTAVALLSGTFAAIFSDEAD
jgi:hypothetical protein